MEPTLNICFACVYQAARVTTRVQEPESLAGGEIKANKCCVRLS